MSNEQSHMYFYEYLTGDDCVVSGIVNTPMCNPNQAIYLMAAIWDDVTKQCGKVEEGRLLEVKRL